jgi:hypothetical protein
MCAKSQTQESTLRDKCLLDTVNNTTDEFRQLMKRWQNRLTLHGQSVVEKYKQGRISLICDIEVPVLRAIHVATPAASCENPSVNEQFLAFLVYSANVAHSTDLHNWKQKPVLIEDVEIVQGPQGVIPSFVRFYDIHDEVADCWRGFMYQSAIYGGYKIIPTSSHREPSLVITSLQPGKDDIVNSEVQGRFQIMQGVANDERKIVWNGLFYVNLKRLISSLRITIDANSVRVWCETDHPTVKIIDVLLGPFNL